LTRRNVVEYVRGLMRADRGPSHAAITRRAVAALVVVAALATLAPVAGATTKDRLQAARGRLSQLEDRIRTSRARLDEIAGEQAAQRGQLDQLQGEMNALAGRIDAATSRYEQIRDQIRLNRRRLQRARRGYEHLRGRLDDQARTAYEQGPGSGLDFILGASSLRDLSDRLEFINRISAIDADLANQVQNRANALKAERRHLRDLAGKQRAALADLRAQQRALGAKFAQEQDIYDAISARRAEAESIAADLSSAVDELNGLIGQLKDKVAQEERQRAIEAQRQARLEKARAQRAAAAQSSSSSDGGSSSGSGSGSDPAPPVSSSGNGPFYACPVLDQYAYSDGFGDARYGGGYHLHAGIDMLAPEGTPVIAPFDGYVEQDPNGLGGNAIIEKGSDGYIYGAHLSAYGASGSVSTGDVIGYVGNTGDAAGGPTHLHFEWHPDVIPAGAWIISGAVDPYEYLNEVC
jgi:peptidoglycan hydrolase CwlO-like protein